MHYRVNRRGVVTLCACYRTEPHNDATPRAPQAGETPLAEREEYRGMKVTRIPAEDPDVVRARDDADLDKMDDDVIGVVTRKGTDPVLYLGEPDE